MRDIMALIHHGFATYGYRQGTRECIAYARGARHADETPLVGSTETTGDAREEFEAHLRSQGFSPTRNGDGYNGNNGHDWLTWKAARLAGSRQ